MTRTFFVFVGLSALTAPALAADYPVAGRWGATTKPEQGPIDCGDKRVIDFTGNQRTDSKGGVPAYRNQSVTETGPSTYRIEDRFTTGQISDASSTYTLRKIDEDRIEMSLPQGGTLTLQRCK